MEKQPRRSKRDITFATRFFATLFISTATIATAFIAFDYQHFALKQENYQNSESVRLRLASKSVTSDLEEVVADLRKLAQSGILLDYLQTESRDNSLRLQYEFSILAKNTEKYDQIRFIDHTGKEKIRVNNVHGMPVTVDGSLLQDKSDRYYFQEALSLSREKIHISPLDLNVENGIIEQPFKPIIRFSTPLYALEKDTPAGILVLNYRARRMLSQFEDMMTGSWGTAMILNQKGYWLYNPDHQHEWGFMWENADTFSARFPLAWQTLTNKSLHTVRNDEGLFFIETIQPSKIIGIDELTDKNNPLTWQFVSHIPPQKLHFSAWQTVKHNYKASILILVLTLIFSYVISRLRTHNVEKSKALIVNESRYRDLFENMGDGYALQEALINEDGKVYDFRYLEVNSAFESILGYTRAQVLGKTILELLPNTEPYWLDVFSKVATTGQPARLEQFGGSFNRYFEISASSPGYGLVAVIFSDVTERKHTEDKLRQAATVFNNTTEAIVVTDSDANITSVNQAFTQVTGFTREEALGKNPSFQKSGLHNDDFYQDMWLALKTHGQWQGEIWNRRKNGELYPAWENITAVQNDQKQTTHFISVFSDITVIKQTEKQLSHLAHHDALTGLSNRLVFSANLEQAIERAQRHKQKLALLYLDLDRFKLINDTLGHAAGDQVLKVIAERLKQSVRAQDLVSRLGGDEFTIILEEIADTSDITELAQKIIDSVAKTIPLDEQDVFVTTSIGISVYPDDADNAADLAKAGDSAMYRAKSQGRHTYDFYIAELTEQAKQRLTIESNLRQALGRDELKLYYQPQIDIATGQLVGVEALLRWQHPEMGLLSPEHFIRIAEESRLINLIGDWVIQEACAQTKIWRKTLSTPLRVAINLSLRQLIYDHTVETMQNSLKHHALKPEDVYFELEITESVLQSGDKIVTSLGQLQNMGMSIAIDDFGTGYSSLSHLKHLPIDSLKIDRAFLRNIPDDPDNRAIAVAIISLAHSLGLRVVAEGLETVDQLNFLAQQGCDEAQGFLISKPVPPEEIDALLIQSDNLLHIFSHDSEQHLMSVDQ